MPDILSSEVLTKAHAPGLTSSDAALPQETRPMRRRGAGRCRPEQPMSNKRLWIAQLFMDCGFWLTISAIFIFVAIVLLTVFASISIVKAEIGRFPANGVVRQRHTSHGKCGSPRL